MGGDLQFKILNRAHRTVLRITRGRFGWRLMGMEVVQLTTTGRRSGEPRTVMLTSPTTQNGVVVVVASRGGSDHHPAWYLNLREEPRVLVSRRGRPAEPMVARTAEVGEYDEIWARVVQKFRYYQGYADRSDRRIPLVLLESTASGEPSADY